MTVFGVILAAFAVFAFVEGEYNSSINGMQGLRIFGDTVEQRDFVSAYQLLPGYDFLELSRTSDSPIEVLVVPEQLNDFKNDLNQNNIKYEVFVEDVSKVLEENISQQKKAHRSRANNVFGSFPKYSEIKDYLEAIVEQYSDIAQLFSIGKSYEGRDLLILKISSGNGIKPAVVIDAGIHAREWIAPTTALYAINQMVKNSNNHYLFEDVDIYVIPSLNPDGYEYTHINAETRLWRKTRSRHHQSFGFGCLGVDANRNFDIFRMSASWDPCHITYAGPRPFSEPEALALRNFLSSLQGRLKTYITLHAYGQYFLHPWGFTRTPPETARKLKCVAQAAAAEIYKHRGIGYKIGSPVELLYAASGGSMDWAMAKAGAELSYAIELPGGVYTFAPPPSEIIPIGRETFDAIAVLIKYAKGVRIC